METKIVKELQGEKKKQLASFNANFSETKALLSDNSAAKATILKKMGMGEEIIEYEKNLGKNIDTSKLEDEYGAGVYTHEELKDLCIKYSLRLNRPRHYFGKIGKELTNKILEFSQDNGLRLGIGEDKWEGDYSNFYILAPAEHFRDEYGERIERLSHANSVILLYKVKTTEDYEFYKVIYSWGDSFKSRRLIKGWKRKNVSNWYLYLSIIASIPLILFFGIIGLPFWLSILIGGIIGSLLSLIRLPWRNGSINNKHGFFTERNWNNLPEKIDIV
jgi:hypothetical protein